MRAAILGDTHGLHPTAEELLQYIWDTEGPFDVAYHVGDFGCYPFAHPRYVHPCKMNEFLPDVPKYFVRGNHEDHEFLSKFYHGDKPVALECYPGWHYVPDGLLIDGVFFCGGAWSIDAAHRNRSDHPFRWYHNEQIDEQHMDQILDIFSDPTKINQMKLIITHDAPLSLYPEIVDGLLSWADYKTPKFFDRLVNRLNLHLDHDVTWVFGHLGKSHMRPSAPRDGAPCSFKIGRVNFLLLDVIRDYVDLDKQCDSWTIVEL